MKSNVRFRVYIFFEENICITRLWSFLESQFDNCFDRFLNENECYESAKYKVNLLFCGMLLEKREVFLHFLTPFPWRDHCVKCVQIRSFLWSVFSHIRTEYGEMLRISPYSVRMRENTDQKNLRIWTLFTQWIFQFITNTYDIYMIQKLYLL